MKNVSKRNRWSLACTGLVVVASACVVPALADDIMAKHDMMMHDQMMTMKDGMKDDASKMQMTSDLAKTMVMQHMAMAMCADGKCQKMVDADPDIKKMSDDAMKMANDPEQVKMLAEQLKKDPMAMKQIMMMSMAHDAMMSDKALGGMHDDKMMKH